MTLSVNPRPTGSPKLCHLYPQPRWLVLWPSAGSPPRALARQSGGWGQETEYGKWLHACVCVKLLHVASKSLLLFELALLSMGYSR